MNIIVFDSQVESSQIWQEFASAQGFRVGIFHTAERLQGLAAEAHAVVIDQSVMPQSFLASITTFCSQNPELQVIATGALLRVDDAVDLMLGGAAFAFSKPLSRQRILAILPCLLQKVAQAGATKVEYQQLNELFSKLTTREKDVLNYILIGTSNKDTASLLNVSVRTIESRRAKVYRKLEANNVAELVRKIDRLEHLRNLVTGKTQAKGGMDNSPLKGPGSSPHNIPHRHIASSFRPQVC